MLAKMPNGCVQIWFLASLGNKVHPKHHILGHRFLVIFKQPIWASVCFLSQFTIKSIKKGLEEIGLQMMKILPHISAEWSAGIARKV